MGLLGVPLELVEPVYDGVVPEVYECEYERIAYERDEQDEEGGHYSGEFPFALLVPTMLLNHSTRTNVHSGACGGYGFVSLGVVRDFCA